MFLDESTRSHRPEHGAAEVSHAGMQRDLLPLVEGTTVNTRYGIETDHVLFIASGAFHLAELETHALTEAECIGFLAELTGCASSNSNP